MYIPLNSVNSLSKKQKIMCSLFDGLFHGGVGYSEVSGGRVGEGAGSLEVQRGPKAVGLPERHGSRIEHCFFLVWSWRPFENIIR